MPDGQQQRKTEGEARIIDIGVEGTSFAACMAQTERAATRGEGNATSAICPSRRDP